MFSLNILRRLEIREKKGDLADAMLDLLPDEKDTLLKKKKQVLKWDRYVLANASVFTAIPTDALFKREEEVRAGEHGGQRGHQQDQSQQEEEVAERERRTYQPAIQDQTVHLLQRRLTIVHLILSSYEQWKQKTNLHIPKIGEQEVKVPESLIRPTKGTFTAEIIKSNKKKRKYGRMAHVDRFLRRSAPPLCKVGA